MQSPIQHKAHGLAQLPGRLFEVLWGSMSCCAMRGKAPCRLPHSAGKLHHALHLMTKGHGSWQHSLCQALKSPCAAM